METGTPIVVYFARKSWRQGLPLLYVLLGSHGDSDSHCCIFCQEVMETGTPIVVCFARESWRQ